MVRALSNYFGSIPAVFIDGLLYVFIALFGAMLATFTADDVANYLSPMVIFYLKTLATWGLAVVTAIKMYRSTAFADHQDKKNAAVPSYQAEPGSDKPTP